MEQVEHSIENKTEPTIEKILRFLEKGAPGIELSKAQLIENKGLDGDFHATGGERQLSLRFVGSDDNGDDNDKSDGGTQKAKAINKKGLCTSRFKENITIRASERVKPGTRLALGEAALEISGESKHCYEECELFQAGKICHLAGKSFFAKVIKSGFFSVGDKVLVLKS